jgi:type I restriction enzyme S subunit
MRVEWETRPLGQVCTIKPPKSEARARLNPDELVTFLPMEDLGIDQKFVAGSQAKPLSAVAGSYTYFADGDVLLAKITPCFENGKLGIASGLANGIGFGSSEYIVFRPSAALNKEWLYYFLSRESFREEGAARMAGAVGHKRVAKEFIESYPIPVPPLPEQRWIVAVLDEVFDGIATAKANAEKNLQNARAIFESQLQCVFTERGKRWKQKTLEEIATTFGRGKSKHRPRNAPHLYGGKYPFVQTGDIRNADHIITEYSQTYSGAGLAQSKLWPKGTICITIAANIAETAILGFDACFPDSVIGVVADPKEANVGFIEYLLQSFKVRIQAMGKGSAQANINMGTFENRRFPFPSVTEQKIIVTELDGLNRETQRLVSIYERKLAALEALKKSLLHRAFAGQLTAKNASELIEAVA